MKKFVKKYYVEIILLFAAVVGILLVGNFGFQKDFSKIIDVVILEPLKALRFGFRSLIRSVLNLSTTKLVIWLLVFSALGIVYYRIRERFKHDPENVAGECPRCGDPIKRTHRSLFDRFLSRTFKPHARRYTCTNPYCRWSGLRRQRFSPEKPVIAEPEQKTEQSFTGESDQ